MEISAERTARTLPPITRDEILRRSLSWIDDGVWYSQSSYHTNPNGRYRQDCSGYVSMCWAAGTSYTTATILAVASKLGSRSDLLPGDALLYRSGGRGHIVLFVKRDGNSLVVREMAKPGTRCRERKMTSGEASRYTPIRRHNIAETPSGMVGNDVVAGGGGLVYLIAADGTLRWYKHLGMADGQPSWANQGQPKIVGSGWRQQFTKVFAGPDGAFYAVTPAGKLMYYHHLGRTDGTASWANNGRPVQIGNSGWGQYPLLCAAADGVIYAVAPDGKLYWYRHLAAATGPGGWVNDGARLQIGRGGWAQYQRLFAGPQGTLYAANADGDLSWYRRENPASPDGSWVNDGQRTTIGRGWTHPHLLAGDDGAVYATAKDGDLSWYRHLDQHGGTWSWANNGQPKQIGTGFKA